MLPKGLRREVLPCNVTMLQHALKILALLIFIANTAQASCPDYVICDALYPRWLNCERYNNGQGSTCVVDPNDRYDIQLELDMWSASRHVSSIANTT